MRSMLAAVVLAVVGTTACGSTEPARSDTGKVTVAVAFFPIEQIVQQVGGDAIDLVRLVPEGQAAHEYEPTAKQVAALERVDVVFYLGGNFQPSVERAIASLPSSVTRIDLRTAATKLIDDDPHVWLDPTNMRAMTAAVADSLTLAEPEAGAAFAANASQFDDALAALDARFTAGLATCASTLVVSSHQAFAYLATAYGLTTLPITGISPLDEPSPQDLEAVVALAREAGVTTVFYEENLPDDLARTVAGEIGATTAELDNLESLAGEQIDAGESYLTVMDRNLATLRTGLRCT